MILVGVIPGPSEPPTTAINHYLEPLVNDLLLLLEGVEMKMVLRDGSVKNETVKACLGTVSSDLPATKKLAGSKSFNSSHGCHLCKTLFPRIDCPGNKRDYCQWDCDNWVKRTTVETRADSEAWLKAKTAKEREHLENQNGLRYSVLFRLPYFTYDLIAIEPMHALYLGVSKTVLRKIVPTNGFKSIQEHMQQYFDFNPYAPGGPMSKNLTKDDLGYIKAVELKDFMTTMVPRLLRPLLETDTYNEVMLLIKALRLLDGHAIRISDIDEVHQNILTFAKSYQARYKNHSVPPNFHFMLHLRECIHRFGPISCF